jgi:hypothetical protein
VGVVWDIDVIDQDCGGIFFDLDGMTTSGTTQLAPSDDLTGEVSSTTEPDFLIYDTDDCVVGDEITVEITGCEGPLASGTGLCVTQEVTITFTAPPPSQKQVFLAWAGQRIILEHDWRIPPGDFWNTNGTTTTSDDFLDNNGFCPFEGDTEIIFIKGGGPGNFLPGLGVDINGSDESRVQMDNEDNDEQSWEDFPSRSNDNCISRVLFESEQPGQVDIEAFVDDDYYDQGGNDLINVTKHAFVIYYMKINTINVSLVSQSRSRPTTARSFLTTPRATRGTRRRTTLTTRLSGTFRRTCWSVAV